MSLLQKVYGVAEPDKFISFEDQVMLDHTSFIDGFIPSTHVLIEQKSLGKELNKPIKQSDGSLLSPFQQAKRYAPNCPILRGPAGSSPVTSRSSTSTTGSDHIKKEMEISLQAGELVGVLYDALLKQYKDPEDPETLKSLNKLCVRLVFCLYAEDAGIFGGKSMFHDWTLF